MVATALGLVVAAAAIVPAAAGGAWLVAAGLLVGLSGLVDSLDGALAIGTGRASQRGFVLDSVVDRLTEVAYAAALWVAGAPGWVAVAFGALCWLPDYLRARAGQAGVDRTGPISVWERPTRVAMAGMTLGGAGRGLRAGLGRCRGDRRRGASGRCSAWSARCSWGCGCGASWPDRTAAGGAGTAHGS